MSHSVSVTMIADQEIEIGGKVVNIHDIKHIIVDAQGRIIDAFIPCKEKWLIDIEEVKNGS